MISRLSWKLFLAIAAINCVATLSIGWVCSMGDSGNNGWLASVVVILLLHTAAAVWIVSRITTRLQWLAHAAERISQGDYAQPVYVGTQDELGQLAAQLNLMREDMVNRAASMQRLSTAMAAMTDGVISIDESQQVLFANAAAGRMLGFSPAEANGRSLLESVRSYKLHELVVKVLASGGKHEIEMEWGAEEPRNLLVSGTAVSEGPSTAIVMMIYNLSEQRRLEAMRRDFVANVSHELKTPLSSIKAYAETLSCGGVDDLQNRGRFLQEIETQADRLNSLITDLLSLARIEQGNQQLELGIVPVERVVEACAREQGRAAQVKGIELVAELPSQEILVQVEEDGLRQILINLIDNAIKYTPNGGRVTIGAKQDGEQVSVFVQDTGIGIPKEMQQRVFERFFRVDKARSRELGGTGLGLSIVKHLAQRFGGSVEVASEPGEGTRFTVILPRFKEATAG